MIILSCQDLNQDTGEPATYEGASWTGPIEDFLEGNAEDVDTCERALALAPGESVLLGGGAGVLTRVKRIGGAK